MTLYLHHPFGNTMGLLTPALNPTAIAVRALNLTWLMNGDMIDMSTMQFSVERLIKYVCMYQYKGQTNIRCDLSNYSTVAYIQNHLNTFRSTHPSTLLVFAYFTPSPCLLHWIKISQPSINRFLKNGPVSVLYQLLNQNPNRCAPFALGSMRVAIRSSTAWAHKYHSCFPIHLLVYFILTACNICYHILVFRASQQPPMDITSNTAIYLHHLEL